ncbi:FixH family protein [Massilia sp. W12]|uniref:FixH family protein n=1 Tax=Massilia sp. W12 TaxID=3126507 RepID=UPI0030CF0FCF
MQTPISLRACVRLFLLFLCLSAHAAHALEARLQPLTRASSRQVYMVTLIPPPEGVAINRMHSWQVRLSNAEGKPVEKATFRIDGGMPQHNHGLPTRPQVTQNRGHGIYLLEGMRFNMPGWWELTLHIESEKQKDRVNFQILIDLPPAPGAAPAQAGQHSGMNMPGGK